MKPLSIQTCLVTPGALDAERAAARPRRCAQSIQRGAKPLGPLGRRRLAPTTWCALAPKTLPGSFPGSFPGYIPASSLASPWAGRASPARTRGTSAPTPRTTPAPSRPSPPPYTSRRSGSMVPCTSSAAACTCCTRCATEAAASRRCRGCAGWATTRTSRGAPLAASSRPAGRRSGRGARALSGGRLRRSARARAHMAAPRGPPRPTTAPPAPTPLTRDARRAGCAGWAICIDADGC